MRNWRSAFIMIKSLFRSHDLVLATKISLIRCFVFSTLLYGVEAWTLSKASLRKLEALEMWCYKHILRISWVDRVTHVD
ncbi:unnamed protein product [Diabrotica balteata]|uniref:Uncharacterized protein n=1 Tax=Diabrotica balteata TaxID=107213 RepID=A0A9N9T524_DIABA|nr:unnamed protein product [Diabrotica balteata]